jgi:hypothetical protein
LSLKANPFGLSLATQAPAHDHRKVRGRKELLLKLVAAGHGAIQCEATDRGRAVLETAGILTDVYEPDELDGLREDWPA